MLFLLHPNGPIVFSFIIHCEIFIVQSLWYIIMKLNHFNMLSTCRYIFYPLHSYLQIYDCRRSEKFMNWTVNPIYVRTVADRSIIPHTVFALRSAWIWLGKDNFVFIHIWFCWELSSSIYLFFVLFHSLFFFLIQYFIRYLQNNLICLNSPHACSTVLVK